MSFAHIASWLLPPTRALPSPRVGASTGADSGSQSTKQGVRAARNVHHVHAKLAHVAVGALESIRLGMGNRLHVRLLLRPQAIAISIMTDGQGDTTRPVRQQQMQNC